MLRIISGKYRSRLIKQPNKNITRVTTDRVREAVFSSIRSNLENCIVLDLFAGSGAWSIEAVSNGAMKAISIEKNLEAFTVIKENLFNLKITNVELRNEDALDYVKHSNGRKFDYIFIDAPFNQYQLVSNILRQIIEQQILNKNGYIIVESDNFKNIDVPEGFIVNKEKKYGKITIHFLSNNN